MSVLVYIDHAEGKVKKASLEALCYAAKYAETQGTQVTALVLGSLSDTALASLSNYGATAIWHDSNSAFDSFDSSPFTKAIATAATQANATVVVLSHNSNGKAIAPRLSARLKAGLVAGAIALPNTSNGEFVVQKSVFSGKAFAFNKITTPIKIVSVNPNAFAINKNESNATVSAFNSGLSAADWKIKVLSVEKQSSDTVPLPEAELVVSAGRGMKGPENWHLIEDLAKALGATTACSRPVADVHWRPHHEHVGQTGITIRPNLYIAIGISGAIQHLAGVNNSKVIVVINKDSEAPFFKAADYGIIGDAFDVLPKLTAAVKTFKAQQH